MKENELPITTEIAIFSVSAKDTGNYRKLSEKSMSVLLMKDQEKWGLPSGFVLLNESIDDCANRVLVKETNIHDIYIEQLYTFGSVDRYPGRRVVSTSYVALIDKNRIKDELAGNVCWFDISFIENDQFMFVNLNNGTEELEFKIKKTLRKNSTDRYSYEIAESKNISLDHPVIIASGISRIKSKLEYTNIVFNMMGEEFTIGELQQVYETILGKKLLSAAFRRIIADKIEKTGRYKTGNGHRPSELYRLKK